MFVAMDSETKLVPCYRVGKRTSENAWYFTKNYRNGSLIASN